MWDDNRLDDRFDGLDKTLGRLDSDVRELRTDMREMRTLMFQLWGTNIAATVIAVVATRI